MTARGRSTLKRNGRLAGPLCALCFQPIQYGQHYTAATRIGPQRWQHTRCPAQAPPATKPKT